MTHSPVAEIEWAECPAATVPQYKWKNLLSKCPCCKYIHGVSGEGCMSVEVGRCTLVGGEGCMSVEVG